MSNQIALFENSQFGSVRVIMRGEDPWFVAADVCKCLGIINSRDTVAKALDEDEKMLLSSTVDFGYGASTLAIPPSGLTIISESGLYSLVIRSNKSEAKEFRRWVTHEVIPSIRKTGMYMPDFNDPVAAARAWADAEEKRILAEREAKEKQLALEQEQAAHEDTLAELGRAKQYRSCLAQGTTLSRWFNIRFVDYEGDSFYGNCGKLMTMLCNGGRCGKLYTKDARFNSTTFDMVKEHVPNSRFGYINAYDVKAWEYFFKLCEQFDPHEFPYVGTFAL